MGMRQYFDHFRFFNLLCTYAWGKFIWHIVSTDFLRKKNKTASNEAAQQTPIPGVRKESPLYICREGGYLGAALPALSVLGMQTCGISRCSLSGLTLEVAQWLAGA